MPRLLLAPKRSPQQPKRRAGGWTARQARPEDSVHHVGGRPKSPELRQCPVHMSPTDWLKQSMWRAVRVPASAFCLAVLLAAPSAAWAGYHGRDAASPATHARLHPDGVTMAGKIPRAERKPLAERPGPHLTTEPDCAEPLCGLRGAVHEIEAEP